MSMTDRLRHHSESVTRTVGDQAYTIDYLLFLVKYKGLQLPVLTPGRSGFCPGPGYDAQKSLTLKSILRVYA